MILGDESGYKSWRRLDWTPFTCRAIDGPEWDIKTEDASESAHRKNLAKMVTAGLNDKFVNLSF